MRAMQIIEWGKPLEPREYPDPEPEGEEVLLRVEAAGVCHSDVHIWDGHFDLGGGQQISLESRGVHLPFTMGHEIAGEVAALGPKASGVKVGDKVVAYPWIGCGECAVCRKGEELLCLRPRTLGTRRAGGYGTHVIVPHGRYLLPHQGVPQGLAATYTCSGITAFSALKRAGSAAVPCTSRRRPSTARSSSPTSIRRSGHRPARWARSRPSTTPPQTRSSR